MALIIVDKSRLRDFESDARQLSRNVNNIRRSISLAGRQLDWNVSSSAHIRGTINLISEELENQAAILEKMADFFDYALSEYKHLEKEELEVLGNFLDNPLISSEGELIRNDLLRWLGKANPLLSAFSPILSLTNNLLNPYVTRNPSLYNTDMPGMQFDYFDILPSIGSTAKLATKTIANWGGIYSGRSELVKDSIIASKDLLTLLVKDCRDDFVDFFTLKSCTMPMAGTWSIWSDRLLTEITKKGFMIQAVSSLGLNFYENFYEEYEVTDRNRAIAETYVETSLDVTKAIVGAAVVAAFPPVGIPLALGSIAVDHLVKYSTGKDDLTEYVSDMIIDTQEDLRYNAKKILEDSKEIFNDLVNCYKNPTVQPHALWKIILS